MSLMWKSKPVYRHRPIWLMVTTLLLSPLSSIHFQIIDWNKLSCPRNVLWNSNTWNAVYASSEYAQSVLFIETSDSVLCHSRDLLYSSSFLYSL